MKRRHSAHYDQPLVKRGLEYAEAVVAGEIPNGKYAIAACQRQLDDLSKDWDYYFDADEAERVCIVAQLFPHVKGKWSGRKLELEPFQCFMYSTLFGWRKKKNHKRRFWEAYICIPRKNGKSMIAAVVGHIMFSMDGENGAEVYCGARTEKQAWEVYGPARKMAQRTPDYTEECGVEINAKTMVNVGDGSKFEPVVGDPGDGASPSCYIIDEFHEHKTPIMYDTAKTGMGSREQPLLFVITTAGVAIEGPCFKRQKVAQRVLDGVEENDGLFSMIFHADINDDWSKLDVLRKANPNFGVSVSQDFLATMQKQAINDASEVNTFKTKHLNLWVSSKTAWINTLNWNKCEVPGMDIGQFKGKDCLLSIDLSNKWDFTCNMRMFPIHGDVLKYALFPRFYLPEQTIIDDKTGKYQGWHTDGWLTATDGKEVDFKKVRKDAEQDLEDFNVLAVPYDPWSAVQLSRELEDAGAPNVTKYANNVANMTEPMREVESAINTGRILHDGNPILTYMFSNVVKKVTEDGKGMRPVKEGDENKIDGATATIQAVGCYMRLEEEEETISIYEQQGARSL